VKQSQRIAKNTAFGMLAAGVGGGLQFLSLLIAARYLGVADFGILSYLLAFATIFQFVADFGLSNILVREMTRRPTEVEYLLGGAKALMWVLFGLGLLLLLGVVAVIPVTAKVKTLSWFISMGYLARLNVVAYSSVLRSKEHMEFNSIAFILHKVVMICLFGVVIMLKWGLWGIVFADFSANMFLWIYYSLVVSIGFSPGRLHCDFPLWKSLLAESIPLGSGLILRQSAWQLDMLILGFLVDPVSLGLFSGPFRILMGMSMVSGLLTQPLFPLFVRLAHQAREEFAVVYQRTIKWFCLVSFPLMTVCLAWPGPCIGLFFGKHFLPGAPALMILSLAIFSIFVSVLYPYLFSALGRQTDFVMIMAGAVAARISLEFLLVPRFGYLSECGVIVGIEFLLFLALSWRLRVLGLPLDFRSAILRPAFASGLCLLALIYLPHGNLAWMAQDLLLCAVIYGAVLFWTKTLVAEELVLIREGVGFLKPYWNTIQGKIGAGRRTRS
jgi:O-antigen/teichoic acid export membrane protein